MLPINEATIALIKRNEGCSLPPYQDMVGVWTNGWGHTEGVTADTPPLTQEQADRQLIDDLNNIYGLKVAERLGNAPTTANQFGAMVSLAFNVGVSGFDGSTVAREHCAGNFTAAAAAFEMWDQAGGHPVEALLRRRREESALYSTPDTVTTSPATSPATTDPLAGLAPLVASFEAAARTLQAHLYAAGLYRGEIDAIWGEQSQAALLQWKGAA